MNQRKVFAVFIFVFFLGALALVFFSNNSELESPTVKIAKDEAYELYGKEDLQKIYKVLLGKGFRVTSDFSKVPFVDKAVLVKSLVGPNHISIYLQQPILAFSVRGVYKLVDKNGEVFSEVPQYKIPNLPIISGQKFEAKKNRAKAVQIFLQFQNSGLLSKKSLSEIVINEDLTFVFSGVKGRVFIGEGSVQSKLQRLTKVIKYLRFHGLEAETLDARFEDRVIVSLSEAVPKIKES